VIYVASRVKHAYRWQTYRAEGAQINSSWIDEAGDGETADFGELWERIVREVNAADGLLFFAFADDFPLKGALVEVGIAIQCGKPIYLCIPGVVIEGRTSRPIGSWINHPLVKRIGEPKDCFTFDAKVNGDR
jgi:hypothetical protein